MAALGEGRAEALSVRYDEVRDWPRFQAILDRVDWWDGSEWITLAPRKFPI